jgi:hypothetical protein
MAKFILTYKKSSGLPPKVVEGRDIIHACKVAGTRFAQEKRAGMIKWEEVEVSAKTKAIETSSPSFSSSSVQFGTGLCSPEMIVYAIAGMEALTD